jgi:hypothetical protein
MIDGTARDKLSDLATNVIRDHLATYTRDQCALFDIPIPPWRCRRASTATRVAGRAVTSMSGLGRQAHPDGAKVGPPLRSGLRGWKLL